MPVVSVHLTNEESKLVERYCAKHGMSLSDAFKTALIEKIEDEYDVCFDEPMTFRTVGEVIDFLKTLKK